MWYAIFPIPIAPIYISGHERAPANAGLQGPFRGKERSLVEGWRGDIDIFEIGIRGGAGHTKIHPGGFCGAKIPVGASILHLVEGLTEHGVVRLLPIQEKIDGLLDLSLIHI